MTYSWDWVLDSFRHPRSQYSFKMFRKWPDHTDFLEWNAVITRQKVNIESGRFLTFFTDATKSSNDERIPRWTHDRGTLNIRDDRRTVSTPLCYMEVMTAFQSISVEKPIPLVSLRFSFCWALTSNPPSVFGTLGQRCAHIYTCSSAHTLLYYFGRVQASFSRARALAKYNKPSKC